MNILILEDEIPAYEKLQSLVVSAFPDAQIVGWGRSIFEGKQLLAKSPQIDLIFSDIKLLDGNSFEIFEAVKVDCPIIFCTAFDQYLFQAFQTNGIAYLLKPYSEEKFQEALEKYQTLFAQKQNVQLDQTMLSSLKDMIKGEQKSYKKRFSIKKKGGIKILNVEDISNIEANGDFSIAYDSAGQKHLINYMLGDIESKINPEKFFRINRSEIVNIDYIEKIDPYFKNKLAIQIKNHKTTLYTSSTKTPMFRVWLDS